MGTGLSVASFLTLPFGAEKKVSDFTLVSGSVNFPVNDRLSFGLAGGFGFDTNGSKSMAVFDASGKFNYNDYLNANIRNRFKIGDDAQSYQLRVSPLSVSYPVGNCSIYLNPNCKVAYDFSSHKVTPSFSAFAGVAVPLKDGKEVDIEFEGYDLNKAFVGDLDKTSFSVNGIVKF